MKIGEAFARTPEREAFQASLKEVEFNTGLIYVFIQANASVAELIDVIESIEHYTDEMKTQARRLEGTTDAV